MYNNLTVQPFALEEAELADIEQFARRNELTNIARLCAELRALRAAFMTLSARVGRAANGQPAPELVRMDAAKSESRKLVATRSKDDEDPNDFTEA